jgi:hypothetical protein
VGRKQGVGADQKTHEWRKAQVGAKRLFFHPWKKNYFKRKYILLLQKVDVHPSRGISSLSI